MDSRWITACTGNIKKQALVMIEKHQQCEQYLAQALEIRGKNRKILTSRKCFDNCTCSRASAWTSLAFSALPATYKRGTMHVLCCHWQIDYTKLPRSKGHKNMGNWYSLKFKQCHREDHRLYHLKNGAGARDVEKVCISLDNLYFKNLKKISLKK